MRRFIHLSILSFVICIAAFAQDNAVFIELTDSTLMVFPRECIENQTDDGHVISMQLKGDTTITITKARIKSQNDTYQGEYAKLESFKFNNKYNDQLFTDAVGTIDDENGNVLMTHDYESGKEYPSFEEGLRFIKENSDDIKVNVDLKRSSASFAADEIIRSLGMEDRCFFTGVNEKDVPAVASTVSIPYYINIRSSLKEMFDEEYWISVASRINALGGVGINSNFRLITKKGVEICKKNSLLVSVFTPDSETELNYALTLSPDNITTRNPELILSKRRFVK